MSERHLFVVGRKFAEFADGKDALTVDQFQALAALPDRLLGDRPILILGQGVREDEVAALLRAGKEDPGLAAKIELSDLERIADRAPSTLSHKHQAHNTVIGTPRRIGPDRFTMPILIDERCELMGDHQTGQHVQGMLLVEAFRQSFLAVTEAFYPIEGASYFVINEMVTRFSGFVFPLPAEIDYRVDRRDANERRSRFRVSMSAIQQGADCAGAEIAFTVYPAEVIAAKEAELAADVTRRMIDDRRRETAEPAALEA